MLHYYYETVVEHRHIGSILIRRNIRVSVKGGSYQLHYFFMFVTSELLTGWTDFVDTLFPFPILIWFWQCYPWENHISRTFRHRDKQTNNPTYPRSRHPISIIFLLERIHRIRVWLSSDYGILFKSLFLLKNVISLLC